MTAIVTLRQLASCAPRKLAEQIQQVASWLSWDSILKRIRQKDNEIFNSQENRAARTEKQVMWLWGAGGRKAIGWVEILLPVLTGPANLTSEAFLLRTRRYADSSKKPQGLASGRTLVQTCPLCHPDRSDL